MPRKLLFFILFVSGLFAQTPQYPANLSSTSTLLQASNFFQANLVLDISPTDNTLSLTNIKSTLIYPTAVVIDTEIIKLCSNTGTIYNVCTNGRGYDKSLASAHHHGIAVKGSEIAWYHNAVVAELIAIEQALGVNLNNVGSGGSSTLTGNLFSLVQSALPPVTSKNISFSGISGIDQYWYWVVAKYAVGDSLISSASTLTNLGNGTITLSWSPPNYSSGNIPNYTVHYDVLRTHTSTFPISGSCTNCLVASNITSTSITDNFGALPVYTLNPFSLNNETISIDNTSSDNVKIYATINGIKIPLQNSYGNTLPLNCNIGDTFYKIGVTTYTCSATNVWSTTSQTNLIVNVTDPPFNADNTGIIAGTAIQAAIDSCHNTWNGIIYGSQCTVFIPAGVYLLNTQLNLYSSATHLSGYAGMKLVGAGKRASLLYYSGPASLSPIKMVGTMQEVSNLGIINNISTGWIDAINYTGTLGIGVSTDGRIADVYIDCQNNPGNGIEIGRDGYQADQITIDHPAIFGCSSGRGIFSSDPNAVSVHISNPSISHTWIGISNSVSTNMNVIGGELDYNDVNFIPTNTFVAYGVRSEGSKRIVFDGVGLYSTNFTLLNYDGGSGNSVQPVTTASVTSGSNLVTLSTPGFTFGDSVVITGAGVGGTNLQCKLIAFTDPLHGSCSLNSSATLASASITLDASIQQNALEENAAGPYIHIGNQFNYPVTATLTDSGLGTQIFTGNSWTYAQVTPWGTNLGTHSPSEYGSLDGNLQNCNVFCSPMINVKQKGELNVQQFGVLSTNTASVNSTAFNTAISDSILLGKKLVVPPGTYNVKNIVIPTLSTNSKLSIIGEPGSILNCQNNDGSDCIAAVSSTFSNPQYTLENLTILGPDYSTSFNCPTTTSGNGLRVSGAATPSVILDHVESDGFCGSGMSGMWFDNVEQGNFQNFKTQGNDTGLKLTGGFNANTLFNGLITYNSNYGVFQQLSASNTFTGLTVQSNRKSGWYLNGGVISNTFNSTHFENNNTSHTANTYALVLNSNSTNSTVASNVFTTNSFWTVYDNIYITGLAGILTNNNTFIGGYTGGANPLITMGAIYEAGNNFISFTNIAHIAGWSGNDMVCGGYLIGCNMGNATGNQGAGFSSGTSSNTDLAGKLTLTAGTVTRSLIGGYLTAPVCIATDTTASNPVKVTTTTTTMTLNGTGSDVVNYVCVGLN